MLESADFDSKCSKDLLASGRSLDTLARLAYSVSQDPIIGLEESHFKQWKREAKRRKDEMAEGSS